jgi:hypothetical protein
MHILCVEGTSRYGAIAAFTDGFVETAVADGHRVTRAHVRAVLSGVIPPDVDIVFSFGGIGAGAPFPVPFMSYLIDHPVWNPQLFMLDPAKDAVLVIDAEHVELLRSFFGLELPAGFVPHAIGVDVDALPPSFDERDRPIEVLFPSSVQPEPLPKYETDNKEIGALVEGVAALARERWAHPMRDIEICRMCVEVEQSLGLELTPSARWMISPILAKIDEQLRNLRRLECVKALDAAGVTVHLPGGGWETVAGLQHAKVLGVRDQREIVEMTREAKVVLNAGPVFNHGWHERIPMAMANGAMVVTDTNDWLDGDPSFTELISTFTMPELGSLPDVVRSALADPKREARTREAYEVAFARHTWEERTRTILRMIEP